MHIEQFIVKLKHSSFSSFFFCWTKWKRYEHKEYLEKKRWNIFFFLQLRFSTILASKQAIDHAHTSLMKMKKKKMFLISFHSILRLSADQLSLSVAFPSTIREWNENRMQYLYFRSFAVLPQLIIKYYNKFRFY